MSKAMRVAVALLLALLGHSSPLAQPDNMHFGHLYMYEKAETYSSILGGKVHLLTPAGFDALRDASLALLVEGEISRETTRNVKTLLDRTPGVRIVYLDSPGGDLFAGLDLGRHLSALDIQAIVGSSSQCASACALAFLGARSRLILAKPGSFGFHRQYYIRNGEIHYGSWRQDLAVIEAYLKQIGHNGVRADEIVGTTGLITYSESRLVDRGIVTITRRDHRKRIVSILGTTGASAVEKYTASCLLHAEQFDCGSMFYAFRLPMIYTYFVDEPSQSIDLKALQELRPYFRAVRRNQDLSAINCSLMREDYIAYLNDRLTSLNLSSPPRDVYESYRESAQKEANSCADLLASTPKPR
jgi:hypothetical protein